MVKRRTVYAKIEGSSPFSFGDLHDLYIYITNYIVDLSNAQREVSTRDGARGDSEGSQGQNQTVIHGFAIHCITHYATWPDQSVTTLP